ncbi:hypothetical protein [Corynebacterium vitaeruminis]|uniref:Secreted protein n=1 Tax=Corynebacterium vitaeruminis DSM 20294 TaxID=1224164 RepID=W5Y3T5_9CORY|nr:hypothetical protein [Corynebacterium vitaeruminis]AHI23574.1 hypothetical protein B843_10980 [Corynebacterium vitaeruminis DSM 20294]
MSLKLRRGVVAAATSVALVATAVPAANAQTSSAPVALSAETGSSTGLGLVGAALSLGISLAFWGTVYNALVSRGTIPGQIIPQLPVL